MTYQAGPSVGPGGGSSSEEDRGKLSTGGTSISLDSVAGTSIDSESVDVYDSESANGESSKESCNSSISRLLKGMLPLH